MDRRGFMASALFGLAYSPQQRRPGAARQTARPAIPRPAQGVFWPNGARMVVSLSMQFEAGDDYGFKEGIPRLLDMVDRRKVKTTSHMAGSAVEKHPQLAKEIVQRGHEAAARGESRDEDQASYEATIRAIEAATGMKPIGFHAADMRSTPNTLEILQDLGFLYYSDDPSRDEPFVIAVRKKPFMVVPDTFQLDGLRNDEVASELKREFDALYEEAAMKRRMLSVSLLDRVEGRASRAGVIEEFIGYAQKHPGIVFMRKDEIARYAMSSPLTVKEGEFER